MCICKDQEECPKEKKRVREGGRVQEEDEVTLMVIVTVTASSRSSLLGR